MVHESLTLCISNEIYTFIPSFLDPSAPSHNLIVNRDTGLFKLDNAVPEPSSPIVQVETLTVYGIYGVIKLIAGDYLLVITERERIGRLGSHDIFIVKKIRVLPIPRGQSHLNIAQAQDEVRYIKLIENQLTSGLYYFSYTYDLTHTAQRRAQFRDKEEKPLWERADDRFFWNRYVQSKLIDLSLNNYQGMSDYILPVISGFVKIIPTRLSDTPIVFSLISRRSRFRVGTRFFSRGIDEHGNVSNFNETEQLVLLDSSQHGQIQLSYVQTRGSVPIYWRQISNLKYTPKLQLLDLPNTIEAFRRHFDEQIRIYGNQILINLVNKKGYEYPIGEAYEKAVKQLNDPRLHYVHFDFHHECRKMRWDRIQILIDTIKEDLAEQGYFFMEQSDSTFYIRTQTSIVRTNCMDCLDRTNVVQSALAKWILTQQLREVGLLSDSQLVDELTEFMSLFRNVWADNADAVSLAYSGTGALKTDYTRTGTRSKIGAIQDFHNSYIRYLKGNFTDGARQDAYDLILGNYKILPLSTLSPFADIRPNNVKALPQAILIALFLLIATLLVPRSDEYPNLTRIIFWGIIFCIILLIQYAFEHGTEFVNWPNLVPLESRYHEKHVTNTSSHKSLHSRRKSELVEYGKTEAASKQYVTSDSLISPRALHLPRELRTFDKNVPEDCPPCFDCHLSIFECLHFANCSDYDGKCKCPPGFGGEDCSKPLCNSLADGPNRHPREDGQLCQCSEGWSGLNCNVCTANSACDPLVATGMNGTCYKGGLTVNENFQICDVTNRKILDMLPEQPPQVTFSCNRPDATCDFQFWINRTESFYCHLDECSFEREITYEKNITQYDCKNIKCRCKEGEMLCGKDNSIGAFKCYNSNDCRFSGKLIGLQLKIYSCHSLRSFSNLEPAMNELIQSIFGDQYITLDCDSGECLHYTQVPGFVRPTKPDNTKMIIASVIAVLAFVLGIFGGVFHLSHNWKTSGDYNSIRLPDDEAGKLMTDHIPAKLLFQNVSYSVSEKQVLDSVHGVVRPGEIMAIMGASGAGKTSFLDILARKNKAGTISGDIYVNGCVINDEEFKNVVGYVDQEDHLLPTLTVYETILYSALLRLPRKMSLAAKKFRVMETMSELGILEIKDSKIGDAGTRSISGGEKRRVSIACELVTSPSILFLDEPTSGLDSYNAYNVVECLVTLARNYNRTVVCTIHQPRSNIFALFDQLILLAEGHMVYSGEASKCQEYFESIGHKCPPGFNIADYLVDLTMYAIKPRDESIDQSDLAEGRSTAISSDINSNAALNSERLSTTDRPTLRNRASIHDIQDLQLYTPHRPSEENIPETNSLFELNNRNRLLRENQGDIGLEIESESMSEHLKMLIKSYRRSLLALGVKDEINRSLSDANGTDYTSTQELSSVSSHRRASWFTQFRILSDRTFKNLYRNPMLMLTHYCISVYLALLCGALYYNVTNDIAGFQNRMGVLFFMCALFGFGCLSSIHIFASERILFVKERANGYYAPITYFASKVIFDIIPLRVVPPILMGVIIYHMVGLVNGTSEFLKFILVLVLFNLTAASICLCIGIVFKQVGVASLLSSLIMLFSMLFGGLFLNKESIPHYLAWLKHLSFFNYAFEALLVNEVVYLQLTEQKFGLSIDVPGATILTTFGFDASAYWRDVIKLATLFASFILLSFLFLQFFLSFSLFLLFLPAIFSNVPIFVAIEPASISAGRPGTGLTGLGIHLSAKKYCIDSVYSCGVSHKKPKRPVVNDTIDSSVGLLSMGDLVSAGIKPVDSIVSSISGLSDVENIKNTVVEETSYADSDTSFEYENMNDTTLRKTRTRTYILGHLPKQPSFNCINNDDGVLELPLYKKTGSNQMPPFGLCALVTHSFNLTKSFTLDIELSAVLGKCTVICFEDGASKLAVINSVPVFKSVSLCWTSLLLVCYAKCKQFGHVSDVYSVVSFSGKTWAQVAGGFSSLLGSLSPLSTGLSSGTKSSISAWSFSNSANPHGVFNLFNYLVFLKWFLKLLTNQISDIVRNLSFVELVPLPSVSHELPLAVFTPLAPEVNLDMVLNSTPESSALSISTVVDDASGFSLNSSKILTTKMGGLELKMIDLVWKFATCNIWNINVPAKQVDVVYWHISSENMVSFVTETKLRYLGAGVAVVINNSLAYYISKIKVVPGWVILVQLLFKSKILVFVLGLYTGASADIRFGQASKVNSIIAKAVNTSTFVVLGGNFNEYGSGKSASFKFCSNLGLVNSFNGYHLIKAPMWCNSRGAERTIDYIFVSESLFSTIVKHWIGSVSNFFNTDHNAVAVSIGLSELLDVQLNGLYKQAYKNHWKFKIKDVDSTGDFQCSKNKQSSKFLELELLVAKIVKRLESDDTFGFNCFVEKWSTLDADKALVLRDMVYADQKMMNILKYLSIVRKEYRKSKMYELKLAQKTSIKAAIEKCMEKFCLDKDSMIKSVLNRPF
ncbi:hypothetical protein G9A89_022509 [Geosiphon pyriformis]|nr:hypothetical protein G9A89_022509 [Geosiphon pyriformis]